MVDVYEIESSCGYHFLIHFQTTDTCCQPLCLLSLALMKQAALGKEFTQQGTKVANTQEKLNLEDNCMGQSLGVDPRVKFLREKPCILVSFMPTFPIFSPTAANPTHLIRPLLVLRHCGFGFQCTDFTRAFCITVGVEPFTVLGSSMGTQLKIMIAFSPVLTNSQ